MFPIKALRGIIGGITILFSFMFLLTLWRNAAAATNAISAWADEQECSFKISDPELSIDGSIHGFDGQASVCKGKYANKNSENHWTFTRFAGDLPENDETIQLEVHFYVTGWADDGFALQASRDYGASWETVTVYERVNPPPGDLTPKVFPLPDRFIMGNDLSGVQVRFTGFDAVNRIDQISIHIDAVRIMVPETGIDDQSTPTPLLTLDPIIPSGQKGTITPITPEENKPTVIPTQGMFPSPTPFPTPVIDYSDSPHGSFSAMTSACAGCHRSHTAPGGSLMLAAAETGQCFHCHSESGYAETAIEQAFSINVNSTTAFFSHPVIETESIHQPGESNPGDFGGENRHTACGDCHDPHYSDWGDSTPPLLHQEMQGASGVAPVYDGPGTPGSFTFLETAEYEYQVCFKCHSSYTQLPTYSPAGWNGIEVVELGLAKLTNIETEQVLDLRDKAAAFNPLAVSYHPVSAAGANLNIPPGSFVSGWSVESRVYCTNCHSSPDTFLVGAGPHGGQLHLLDETSPYITVAGAVSQNFTGGEVCFQCHRAETYMRGSDPVGNTFFRIGNRNLHQSHSDDGGCYLCHSSHSSNQKHLLNMDASINNTDPDGLVFLNGYDGNQVNSQTFWQVSPDGQEKTCFISCHEQSHTIPGRIYLNENGD